MNRFYFIFLVLFFSATVHSYAQFADSVINPPDKITVGVGAGYDFGGIGVNGIYYIQRSVGVFAGAGYAFAGVGFNAGVKLRALTNKSASILVPFVLAMYGYNAEAAPKGYAIYNKIFYNATFGAGLDYRPKNSKFGYLTATLLLPLRTPDAQTYINSLSLFRGIDYHNKLHIFSGSIGYKFILFK
jgi:hypothetical protein